MTVASVTTDIEFGPYKIPSNAQNMIMNNYANRKNLKIEVVIPEPIFSNQLATTKWLTKDFNFTDLLLCSIYQLPKEKKYFQKICEKLNQINFHFAIEGINGIGENFLVKCINEVKLFQKSASLNTENKSWLEMYDAFQKEYK